MVVVVVVVVVAVADVNRPGQAGRGESGRGPRAGSIHTATLAAVRGRSSDGGGCARQKTTLCANIVPSWNIVPPE